MSQWGSGAILVQPDSLGRGYDGDWHTAVATRGGGVVQLNLVNRRAVAFMPKVSGDSGWAVGRVSLDLRMAMPADFCAIIHAPALASPGHHVILGLIDSGYRGTVMAVVVAPKRTREFAPGTLRVDVTFLDILATPPALTEPISLRQFPQLAAPPSNRGRDTRRSLAGGGARGPKRDYGPTGATPRAVPRLCRRADAGSDGTRGRRTRSHRLPSKTRGGCRFRHCRPSPGHRPGKRHHGRAAIPPHAPRGRRARGLLCVGAVVAQRPRPPGRSYALAPRARMCVCCLQPYGGSCDPRGRRQGRPAPGCGGGRSSLDPPGQLSRDQSASKLPQGCSGLNRRTQEPAAPGVYERV